MIGKFTDPFRYSPHPLVRSAAESVISDLDRKIEEGLLPKEVCKGFKEGKMLGVLICESTTTDSEHVVLAGFSGSVGNCSMIEGFVPPIYDLTDPNGYFKEKEAEITKLNHQISELQNSTEYCELNMRLSHAKDERDSELEEMRARMAASKQDRARRRAEGCDPELLIKESQFEKAEFKRLKLFHESKLQEIRDNVLVFKNSIDKYKQLRASMSDALQEWIFKQYRVHNFLGEESSVYDIFASQGLSPQGGTGDCAAPKLLEHAYLTGLKPLAMGEFWYGSSSDTAVRTQGHFYPSCTSKCGPLLGYMLNGLEVENNCNIDIAAPVIIYEDEEVIAVSKPSGVPSVPGLDGKVSVQEWLNEKHGDDSIHSVHRLDMDTSGILLFAKIETAAVELRRQFEAHTIQKTYIARLCASDAISKDIKVGTKGQISLPLAPDYDERPRQKADKKQGKEAVTDYEVIDINPDGTLDIVFRPVTGRTHQLRVHSAHHLGLGRPILGDMLYGGQHPSCPSASQRLHLHAQSISFTHPSTGERITLSSSVNVF